MTAFAAFDTDASKSLRRSEFKEMLEGLGVETTHEERKLLRRKMDRKNSKLISAEEWKEFMTLQSTGSTASERRESKAGDLALPAAQVLGVASSATPLSTVHDDAHLCVVCLDAQHATLLLPCKHLCLCDDCAVDFQPGAECPICRVEIEQTLGGVFT